ncbi:antichymotrypsin-2-like isoform X1 [Anastrepha ludens]|uniref:antichymotrypsin-2-like isoform X1 n=1 Tax=Anastrepha ludens TaxID=28586 RepID=UPI0023B1060A|nr:antichymotrypsin-2-like isoform X1 [Anastrepha ludens]
MTSKIIFIYFLLSLLCCLNLTFTTATTERPALAGIAATVGSGTNATEHTVDLVHLVLERVLAEADATTNFVIAPQELLALYLQLHGTDKEIAAAADSFSANENSFDPVRNEVENTNSAGEVQEYEELFNIPGSPILVSNTLYADVYNSKRFTRKLKNLQIVLHEESDEDDERTGSSGYGSDNNNAAVARSRMAHNVCNNNNRNKNDNCNELINTVRINSRWAHNFQKRDTHKRQFYMPHTHTHAYLHAMRKDDIFPYAKLEEFNATALELSLQRQQLKMLLILPDARDGLPQLLQRLSANVKLLDELCGMTRDTEQPTRTVSIAGYERRYLEPTLVRVSLPKFQFSQHTALDGIFRQLLNATANVDLHWPSAWQVTQDVQFAVSEDGIGELKPSIVLFWNAFSSLRTKPLMFSVDHPFVFIVYNGKGIQLLGHLAQLHE